MAINDIDLDGGEQKICCGYVDKIRVQNKSEILKKVRYRTV